MCRFVCFAVGRVGAYLIVLFGFVSLCLVFIWWLAITPKLVVCCCVWWFWSVYLVYCFGLVMGCWLCFSALLVCRLHGVAMFDLAVVLLLDGCFFSF